ARQPVARGPERPGQGTRLRAGQASGFRGRADQLRVRGRHTGVHEPGAGPRREGRRPDRPVQPWSAAVPAMHWEVAVRGTEEDGRAAGPDEAGTAAGSGTEPVDPRIARRADPSTPGEEGRRPAADNRGGGASAACNRSGAGWVAVAAAGFGSAGGFRAD